MRENLLIEGFTEKEDPRKTDICIINSCTVTHRADRDTRNTARHFHKINRKGKVVIAGCYAELHEDRKALFEIPGVGCLIRNREKNNIARMLKAVFNLSPLYPSKIRRRESRISYFKNRDRAFVKIQDGCNHKCSYCKVNIVRGRAKSRSARHILTEIKTLAANGFREIVLTGICLGAWGMDLKGKQRLVNLIRDISEIDEAFRIRLSSIEPFYITDGIIKELKTNKRLCKHLHVPLQSGDDEVLKRMNRLYTAAEFYRMIRKVRKSIPDIAITTDVLVGFSGEDEKRFQRTVKFIRHINPSRIHVFAYSERAGTAAAKYREMENASKIKERVNTLGHLAGTLSVNFAKKFINKTQEVLFESGRDRKTGFLVGYTDRYVRVLAEGGDSLKNKLLPVKITKIDKQNHLVFSLPIKLF